MVTNGVGRAGACPRGTDLYARVFSSYQHIMVYFTISLCFIIFLRFITKLSPFTCSFFFRKGFHVNLVFFFVSYFIIMPFISTPLSPSHLKPKVFSLYSNLEPRTSTIEPLDYKLHIY